MSVAIIVGASRGLGRQVALSLINDDRFERIICLSRSGEAFTTNPKYSHHAIDITNFDSNPYHLRHILGGHNVSLLINSAGVCFQSPFSSSSFSNIQLEINTNVLGMISITHELVRNGGIESGGHIINVSSLMGRVAAPTFATYSASKFAIVGFSDALELELAPDIKVSCVMPTLIDTDMTKDLETISNLIYPIDVQYAAEEIYKLIFNHSGRKTIGIQAALACATERISPFVTKFLTRL